MSKLAIENIENGAPQLAEDEVARLLATLQSAEFKPSDKHQLKRVKEFQKRSLLDIASAAQQAKSTDSFSVSDEEGSLDEVKLAQANDEGSPESISTVFPDVEAHQPSSQDTTSKNLSTESSFSFSGTSFTDEDNDDPEIEEQSADEAPSETKFSFSGTSFTDEDNDDPEIEGQSADEAPSETKFSFSGTSFADEEDIEAQPGNRTLSAGSFDTAEAAYERGKLDGIEQGKAIAHAEMIEKSKQEIDQTINSGVEELLRVAERVRQPDLFDLESLEKSIRLAVIRLASERAGYAIDECGDYFLERIKSLVGQVEVSLSKAKLCLNPEDIKALAPYTQQIKSEQLGLVADEGIARGDIVFKSGGIEVSDRAEDRINQNVLPLTKTDEAQNVSTVETSAELDQTNTIIDNEPADGQFDSTEQNTDDVDVQPSVNFAGDSEPIDSHENGDPKKDDDRSDP
jgi:hypothetical protein